MVLRGNKRGIGLKYALNGFLLIVKKERNFKIHLIALLLVITASSLLKLTYIEWAIILIVSSIVLITEMLNSAIERAIDYIKPEIHPRAKEIKDMAAGAVLLSAISAVIIGCIIFIRKIYLLM